MEKHKEEEPHFSKAFAELAGFLKDSRRDGSQLGFSQSLNFGKSEMSRFSIPDFSLIQPNESNRARLSLMQDSIMGRETSLDRNLAGPSPGCDYDPLFVESAMGQNKSSRPVKLPEKGPTETGPFQNE